MVIDESNENNAFSNSAHDEVAVGSEREEAIQSFFFFFPYFKSILMINIEIEAQKSCLFVAKTKLRPVYGVYGVLDRNLRTNEHTELKDSSRKPHRSPIQSLGSSNDKKIFNSLLRTQALVKVLSHEPARHHTLAKMLSQETPLH